MKVKITENKELIATILDVEGVAYSELEGYAIESLDGRMAVTRPAPVGEPRHYKASTNTGGRRFVCWVREAAAIK